jgi:TonB family protein
MFDATRFKTRRPFGALALVVALSSQNAAFADPTLSHITDADQSATHGVQSSDIVRLRHMDLPDYTDDLVRSGVQGMVEVLAHVNAGGRVIDAAVAGADPRTLTTIQKNALASVRSATFYPAIENGKATETLVTIPFRFELTDRTVSTFPFKRVAKSRPARID